MDTAAVCEAVGKVMGWHTRSLTASPLLGGLSNELFKVVRNHDSTHGAEEAVEPEAVVARVTAPAAPPGAPPREWLSRPQAMFVNRGAERAVHEAAAAAGIAPALHGSTAVGEESVWVFHFAPGRSLTVTDMLRPEVRDAVAEALAGLHGLSVGDAGGGGPPALEAMLETTAGLARAAFEVDSDVGRAGAAVFGGVDIDVEMEFVQGAIAGATVGLTVVHGDAQPGNWLLSGLPPATLSRSTPVPPQPEGVLPISTPTLIDFEYSGVSHSLYDVGNLFCELHYDYGHAEAPFFWVTPGDFVGFKRGFLAAYARARGLTHSVDDLMDRAAVFSMVSHFQWAMWSMSMAHSNMADVFGYVEYGAARLEAYKEVKGALLERGIVKNAES